MYKRGSRFERELKTILESYGYAVVRSAGSKGVDLIAGKNGRILIFECKSTNKEKIYVQKEDVEKLINFSEIFGGIPYLAIKINKKIFFINPYILENNNKKSYAISEDFLYTLSIENII
ncbi:Holliday junction resolvase Hjc [Methanocaldococcus indicus]|uniref:Holliday junction resolvase Hjc n=1 Tax=Methanocaldococcus indicus TaxID=213231 RepID=UPI003C6D849F